jgi:hypothetical protein
LWEKVAREAGRTRVARAFEPRWRVSAGSNTKTTKDTKSAKGSCRSRPQSSRGLFVVFVSLVILVLKDCACGAQRAGQIDMTPHPSACG